MTHASVECPLGELNIFNVYRPNTDDLRFFQALRAKLLIDFFYNKIVEEDFNTVMYPNEDRKQYQSCRARATDGVLSDLSSLIGLVDTGD